MSSVEFATESAHGFGSQVHVCADPVAKLRTRVYFGFGTAVALGLSLAGWYVGGRILAAEPTPSEPSSSTSVVSTVPPVPVIQPVQAATLPPQPVAPVEAAPAPQLFLEVAGLGARQDALFVKKLHARGLAALIDSGSVNEPRRILVGPFSDQASLQAAQRKLQTFGVLALQRAY